MKKNQIIVLYTISLWVIFISGGCTDTQVSQKQTIHPQLQELLHNYNRLQVDGKGKASLRYLDTEYPKIEQLTSLDYWYIYWNKSRYYLNYEQEYRIADLYADSTVLMLKQLDKAYHDEFVKTDFLKGDIYLAQKKYNQAFKFYYDGREHAIKYLAQCRLSNYTSQLGNVKLNQKKYPEAITYFKKALQENQSCLSDTTFEYRFVYTQSKMNTIGMVYEMMKKPDSAVVYYQKALQFISNEKAANQKDSIFVKRAYGVIAGNLGGAFKMIGNYQEAERLFLTSIAINDQPGYEYQDAMTVKIKLADLYLKTNRAKLSYDLINSLLKEIDNTDGDETQQNGVKLGAYNLLKDYYLAVNDDRSAYRAQSAYYNLRDSLAQVNEGLKSADMDMAFELNAQKYKADMLLKQSELKTAYLLIFGVLGLVAVFSLVFLWRDMKKSRSYISKLKRLNIQNQQTMAALEQSQADNDKIMRIVAHDLRNPLSGITGVVALMLEEDGFSAETKEELALIKSTGENSLALVNELLQINFNVKDLEMNEVDMDELVQYCAELLRHKAATKNQQIIADSFTVKLTVNREKIWRVLSNLIGNAIKFSPNDAVITVSLESNAEEIVVAVSDQGIGIPHQMAAKLFEMFTPSKRVGTAGEESFGMGLSICKQIVEAHGGKIWFESKEGNGSTFYFSLPLIYSS